ncbi:ester cyclase [Actinomycetospora atypica]|uniref:Ester cyclase n=1 Tax=Actinomycetospora atypica TaxID=1290095 RepID=A0ABV9YFS5_9PSEU
MTTDDKATCAKSLELMAIGTLEEMAEVFAPDALNRESKAEPAATRGAGPEAFHATALWLREAHSDLRWEVRDAVQEGDLVVLHTTMTGRQTGPFTAYDENASVAMVFPPTGRAFSVTQTHWFRMREGRIVEHWANRDDRTLGEQLGWTPPSPVYLAKMLLARRRARHRA